MLFARALGLLVAGVLGVCLVLYLITGERRYLAFAWRIFKYALFLLVFVLLLIFAERLWTQL